MVVLKDIPEDQISQEIENFILTGYTTIKLEKQPDGNWTITGEQ